MKTQFTPFRKSTTTPTKNELVKVDLHALDVDIVSRYELTRNILKIKVGRWYLVAVGPFNKRSRSVSAMEMQAIEQMTDAVLLRMKNKSGGIITVRCSDVLQPINTTKQV